MARLSSPQFPEMCEEASVGNNSTNMTQGVMVNCDLLAEVFSNISKTWIIKEEQPDQTFTGIDEFGNLTTTLAPKNVSDLEEETEVEGGGTSSHKINTTKLVVLTITIFFTVVGNFGVVLAILLRR